MQEAHDAIRILVVDDRDDMAEMLADDLCGRGYAGVAVSSGREALRMLCTERIDVLVTDVHMPGIDGIALLRASLRLDPSRPVIMMTAYEALCTAMAANAEGACRYLIKPFRLHDLAQALEQALRDRRIGGP